MFVQNRHCSYLIFLAITTLTLSQKTFVYIMKYIFYLAILFQSFELSATWNSAPTFTGGNREITTFFTINNNGYVGCGRGAGMADFHDLWQYNPNSGWTQKSNYPGTGT